MTLLRTGARGTIALSPSGPYRSLPSPRAASSRLAPPRVLSARLSFRRVSFAVFGGSPCTPIPAAPKEWISSRTRSSAAVRRVSRYVGRPSVFPIGVAMSTFAADVPRWWRTAADFAMESPRSAIVSIPSPTACAEWRLCFPQIWRIAENPPYRPISPSRLNIQSKTKGARKLNFRDKQENGSIYYPMKRATYLRNWGRISPPSNYQIRDGGLVELRRRALVFRFENNGPYDIPIPYGRIFCDRYDSSANKAPSRIGGKSEPVTGPIYVR